MDSAPARPDVTDWQTDFDHCHPDFNANLHEIWADMREGGCPVAHTDRYHGVYMPVKYDDINAIAHDSEHFSSISVLVNDLPADMLGRMTSPPITSDPPDHHDHRRVLLPAFAPKEIEKWRPVTRDICNDLIDGFLADGHCDASEDYAKHIPVIVTARMIGIPEEDGDTYRRWVHEVIEAGPYDLNVAGKATQETFEMFGRIIEERRENPRDDLVSFMVNATMENGEPLHPFQITGGLFLLLLAGIDTTWSTIGSAMLHFGQNPEDRRRLAAEPEIMDRAVEEVLRFYAPLTMARVITEETEVSGTTMCPGQKVLLPFPAANLDPDFLEDADQFVIDREVNRHSAFGLGIHRCLGSNLARMEIKVALEEWFRRIPDFELTDPNAVDWSVGQIRGPRTIPLAW